MESQGVIEVVQKSGSSPRIFAAYIGNKQLHFIYCKSLMKIQDSLSISLDQISREEINILLQKINEVVGQWKLLSDLGAGHAIYTVGKKVDSLDLTFWQVQLTYEYGLDATLPGKKHKQPNIRWCQNLGKTSDNQPVWLNARLTFLVK